MKFLEALLGQLLGSEQCGGTTMIINITMNSSMLCSEIKRFSTCGGNTTTVQFKPPLLLEYAILHSRNYTEEGLFVYTS